MTCLILEDEPLAAQNLQLTLQRIAPDTIIADIIDTVDDAEAWLNANPAPDLIFMDIHLADCLCFELFERIDITSPVIFTTAYDQYAIAAFQTNGIGYLLKPIDEDELAAALKKYNTITASQANAIQSLITTPTPVTLQQQPTYRNRILVKLGDNYNQIPINDIAYFYSEDHYTMLVTFDRQEFIVNHTLDALESQLDPQQFFRISRQCTISINAIGKISKHINGRLKVILNPCHKDETLVSRNRATSFLAWLDGQNQ